MPPRQPSDRDHKYDVKDRQEQHQAGNCQSDEPMAKRDSLLGEHKRVVQKAQQITSAKGARGEARGGRGAGTSAAGTAAAIEKRAPHFLQVPWRPAACAGIRYDRPQPGQVTRIELSASAKVNSRALNRRPRLSPFRP